MEIAAAVALDSITREKVEAPFLDCGKKLKSNTMTREHLINCIAAAEFSEWNNIFVYIVNTLKDARPEFAKAAAGIQAHKHHIENMIASLPEGRMYLETLRRLPPVWTERILLVENHAGVMEFLNAVLSTEVAVETAMNGEEGLDKVRKTFFDVVISDVDLPVMNGIEFYKSASLHDPHIGDRFLFLTGSPTDETLAFFEQRGARFLAKPIHINEFRETVSKLRDKRPIKT